LAALVGSLLMVEEFIKLVVALVERVLAQVAQEDLAAWAMAQLILRHLD
jgi:hypothetical protein